MKTFKASVGFEADGQRLDVFLLEAMTRAGEELSRRKVRAVVDAGGVYINKKRIRMSSHLVRRGDQIRVEYSDQGLKQLKAQAPVFREDDILYDEAGIVAVNKPPGLPSQATRDQALVHVVPALEEFYRMRGQAGRKLILVHRLDKETSGVLLLADNKQTATWLTEQFRLREVKKTYLAVCYGIPLRSEFSERASLSEIDKKTGDVRAVRAGGRSAVTHFKLLAQNGRYGISLIECRPETGRSHQIRVHLALNGLPIVGDKRYGHGSNGRGAAGRLSPDLKELTVVHHFLHALALEFLPGSGKPPVSLRAALPERFQNFVTAARLLIPVDD